MTQKQSTSFNIWRNSQTWGTAISSITSASSQSNPDVWTAINGETFEMKLHPSINREVGFCLSKSWKLLIFSLMITESLPHRILHMGYPLCHIGQGTLPSSGYWQIPSLSIHQPWAFLYFPGLPPLFLFFTSPTTWLKPTYMTYLPSPLVLCPTYTWLLSSMFPCLHKSPISGLNLVNFPFPPIGSLCLSE